MNDENKAPSNDPEKSSKETNSSGDPTSDRNPEASSSNTKETDTSAMNPHPQAEAMTSLEAIDLSEKVAQCKIDGTIQSIFSISLSLREDSCICFCMMYSYISFHVCMQQKLQKKLKRKESLQMEVERRNLAPNP